MGLELSLEEGPRPGQAPSSVQRAGTGLPYQYSGQQPPPPQLPGLVPVCTLSFVRSRWVTLIMMKKGTFTNRPVARNKECVLLCFISG